MYQWFEWSRAAVLGESSGGVCAVLLLGATCLPQAVPRASDDARLAVAFELHGRVSVRARVTSPSQVQRLAVPCVSGVSIGAPRARGAAASVRCRLLWRCGVGVVRAAPRRRASALCAPRLARLCQRRACCSCAACLWSSRCIAAARHVCECLPRSEEMLRVGNGWSQSASPVPRGLNGVR